MTSAHSLAGSWRPLASAFSLAVIASLSLLAATSAAADTTKNLLTTLKVNDARVKSGNGHAAQELCTRVFVSGDPLNRVRYDYVWPRIWPLGWIQKLHVVQGESVTAQIPVWPYYRRTALYRPGLGCTLIPPGTSVNTVKAQDFRPTPLIPPVAAPWPNGENGAETWRMSAALAETVSQQGDRLFEEPSTNALKHQNTNAFLVAKDGHLLYERYAAGVNRAQPQLGWSMTKSLTALIAGVMATDGIIHLDEPVGIPQWTSDSRKAGITWRHLLNNAAGLRWNEEYEGVSDTGSMLYSRANQAEWAANRPWDAEVDRPGSKFNYSTGFVNIAMWRMMQLLGDHQAIYDYYQQRLFAPLGIRDGVIEPDASGTPVGGARGVLRPVDWLRLGQLVAQHGRWNGQPLISEAYMREALAPSPAAPRYGFYLWRKTGQPETEVPVFKEIAPRLPDDTLWFQGFMGQYVVISPKNNLLVLRMGATHDKDETMRRVMTAFAEIHEATKH